MPTTIFDEKEIFWLDTEPFVENNFDSKIKSKRTVDVEKRDNDSKLQQEKIKQIVETKFAKIESQKASNTIEKLSVFYKRYNLNHYLFQKIHKGSFALLCSPSLPAWKGLEFSNFPFIEFTLNKKQDFLFF